MNTDKTVKLHAIRPTQTTGSAEFNKLIALDSPDLPTLPADLLPGWAGDFANALSRATETPPELAVAMILATASTATARRLRVEVRSGHIEPALVWPAVALTPGNRKSAVKAAATAPLAAWEEQQRERVNAEIQRITSEAKTLEARAKELRSKAAKETDAAKRKSLSDECADVEASFPQVPVPTVLWGSDITPERLGIILAQQRESFAWLSSEGGIFEMLAGRYSSGIPNLDLVLKAWSGDSERIDRANRPAVFLSYPTLTVGLSPQPETLTGLAQAPGFRGRGLLARFLFLLPESPLGYRTLDADPVPEWIRERYFDGITAMLDWTTPQNDKEPHGRHVVRTSPVAQAEWLRFARYVESSMRPGGLLEHATDWGGKCPGQAARIACILHAIEHAHETPWSTEISLDTMERALEIIAVIMRHSLAALDLMGADPKIAAARYVWNWIERGKRNGFSIRDAHQAMKSRFSHAKDVRAAFAVLEERGYVLVEDQPKKASGRPRSPIVVVRPELLEG